MIMSKKKKKTLIVVSIIVVLLITLATLILLYIYTDSFKSNSTLFVKYMGQNVENIGNLYQKIGESEYNKLLQENKYVTNTNAKVNFIENIGKTSESTQNPINQLTLEIKGQTDKTNEFNYQDIYLLNNNEEVAEVEYLQSQNAYGIKFSDLFNQYLMVNNENLKDLFRKIGYTDEQLENIPEFIDVNIDLKTIFNFSEEEKEIIREKYIEIINSNISKENFSKQKNQIIKIDGNDILVNGYTLTLTKEQLNNIYIKVLEKVKEDEIILNKINNLQTIIEQYDKSTNLNEQFIEKINQKIAEITKNNIGTEKTNIIVYENNSKTVKTIIETPDYEINMELLSNNKENYMKVSYKDTTSSKDKGQVIEYKKTVNETNASYEKIDGEDIKKYILTTNETVENTNCIKDILAVYEDNNNKVEITVNQNITLVDNFDNDIILDEKSTINLSNLEEEKLKVLLEKVNTSLSTKIQKLKENVIEQQDIIEILKTIGIVKENQVIETIGITETERNRYNSKFEILEGQNLESSKIFTILEAIKDNLVGYEVVSGTELRLNIDRYENKQEVLTTLNTFFEKNKNRKYNITIEYDETTGLVNGILVTILEK